MIVCFAPNPSIDKHFEVERVEPGAIHRPTALMRVPGGKGLNVARAAATLGAEVHVVALLGGHAGRWIADELAGLRIPLTAVWSAFETRSCLSVADLETGSLTEFYEGASPVSTTEWAEFVQSAQELGARASWTTASGSLPPGAPATGYAELVDGQNTVADTRELGGARPALVKVNAAEAAALAGFACDTASAAIAAARALRDLAGGDGHAAVVTRGRHGAVLLTPDGAAWQASLDVIGPYPVGSGDAFLAGLVVALDRAETWPDALRVAVAAGVANAELPGAGRLDRGRAEQLVAHVRLEQVAAHSALESE